jgi:hypothetical protein
MVVELPNTGIGEIKYERRDQLFGPGAGHIVLF